MLKGVLIGALKSVTVIGCVGPKRPTVSLAVAIPWVSRSRRMALHSTTSSRAAWVG